MAFGPLRYLVFMLALLDSYACQSIDAFFSYIYRGGFSLQILLAIVVLSLIGILAPTRLTLWIAGIKKSPSKTRLWLSALSAPILAFVGSLLFSVILPFAGIPFHGLDGDNLIRATNGPVRLLFLANGSQALPPYYSKTPETYTDMVRSHVALMYLSRPNHNRFLKIEYPHLYSEFHEIVMKW
ncbi:MAG: hypothetical protein P4K86_11480 [Terracidiphilus sp.]|nr:hypothetical protein [Terracidiphilus sp.]MDR3776170.1 hypothetical protein [Terracidiphilus sp.]